MKDRFEFFCQHVLPLVYDDSLSYYEVLCKITAKLNELVMHDSEIDDSIIKLIADIEAMKKKVDDATSTKTIEKAIKSYLATMIFVEISQSGYFIYYIPDGWENIDFKTTGVDIELEMQPEYGHLVLSY